MSIHARWSRNPCAVLADTRRASTFVRLRALRRSARLGRINVLARPIQFSKNRPRLPARHPSDCSPRLVGVPNRHCDRVQGNLPTLLQPLRAVNIFLVAAVSRMSAKPPLESDVGNLPSWCPTWEPEKPGTWGQPQSPNGEPRLTNAEGETRYYAPEVGLSTPITTA